MANLGAVLTANQPFNSHSEDYLVSSNGAYFAIMQADGNFCIYPGSGPDQRTGQALWATGSNRTPDADYTFIMQSDGNLCIYPGTYPEQVTWKPIWCAGSWQGPGSYFAILQDDGNLCVCPGSDPEHLSGPVIWTSGSAQGNAPASSQHTASGNVVHLQVPRAPEHLAGQGSDGDPTNLWDNVDHINCVNELDLVVDGHALKPLITTIALQASNQPQEGQQALDYYFIQQMASINPSDCFVTKESRNYGWYVTNYTFNTYPRDFQDSATFALLQTSPDSIQGAESITSGISYSLGGNVGFFGKTPTAGVNLGVTISDSRTISIPDVAVMNQSNDAENNAKWLYNMPEQGAGGVFDTSLHAPVAMSISNFQPTMYALWQGRERQPGQTSVTFVTEFSATLQTTSLDWEFVEYTIHRDTRTVTGQFTFEVPYPPVPLV